MTSTKLYSDATVQAVLLKRQKDGSLIEQTLRTTAKAIQAYREGGPRPENTGASAAYVASE